MLLQPDGTEVARLSDKIQVKAGRATTVSDRMPVKQPMLWTPSTPTLYNLLVRVLDKEGNVIDGYRRRIGIRSIEFKGKDGFYLELTATRILRLSETLSQIVFIGGMPRN